jgi:hypothetical protein
VDISTRKKLIHTMPPNTDRPINRAMVVGCAVSATRNYLKLHEPRSTLEQHSCQNAKVVEAFCRAAFRLSNQCRPPIPYGQKIETAQRRQRSNIFGLGPVLHNKLAVDA